MPGAGPPPQDYFSSAKLRLTIRFDEFGQINSLAAAPKTIIKNLNGISIPVAPLVVTTDPAAPPGVTRYLINPAGNTNAASATSQSSSSDGLTFDVTVIPKEMVWNLNGLRTASTMTASIKYRDCPLDPRTIRSVAVESFMGGVTAADFAAGIKGGIRQGATISGQGEPLNCLADTYVDSNGKQRTNSRFLGWVDKWAVEWMPNAEAMIHIDCRDNTQLLIEQQAPAAAVINMKQPIDQAVATYLANFNQFQGLSVQFLPATDPVPVLGDVLNNTSFRPQLGPQPAKGGGSSNKLSVWDYLTDICGSIGCSVRVDGTTIIIQKPRSLVSNTGGARPDDPYQERTIYGVSYPYRTFIYGRNVKEMHIHRDFTHAVPKNIEVRSYQAGTKTLLVARNRPNGSSSTAAQGVSPAAIPGDSQPTQQWLEFRVPEVKDQVTLNAIAQSIYEQLGRNELVMEIKTDNQASFGGGQLDPDILDMKFGDNFELLIAEDPSSEINTFMYAESQLQSKALTATYLQNLGFSAGFANAYATAYTNVGLPTVFRMKQLKVTWEIERGLSLHVVGINYIEARENRTLPAGQEPGTANPNATVPTTAAVSQSINSVQDGSTS
jgi:hypothetical protein